jgi:hypothetical protein
MLEVVFSLSTSPERKFHRSISVSIRLKIPGPEVEV